jgi:peptidyl-prolyl cis-trans isomerase A (cyclophilin A)
MKSRTKQIVLFITIYALAFLVFKMTAMAQNPAAKVETQKTESPKAEAPKVEAPKADAKVETKAQKTETPAPAATAAPTKKVRFTKMFAKFETTMGTFKIRLFNNQVPKTVDNFVGLAEGTKDWTDPKTKAVQKHKPFYDGLIFHRVIKDFMIQGGDPVGTGMGGPGYQFNDEFLPELKHTKAGILSMANAGPNTNGSQFFITLAPTPHLDGRHTVFGEVVEGLDVVMAIGSTPTNRQTDRPKADVVIKKLTIIRE